MKGNYAMISQLLSLKEYLVQQIKSEEAMRSVCLLLHKSIDGDSGDYLKESLEHAAKKQKLTEYLGALNIAIEKLDL